MQPSPLRRSPSGNLRAAPALAEMFAAVVLGGLAWWCWQHGVIPSVQQGSRISRIDGQWWTAAAAAATLAATLLLDAWARLTSLRVVSPPAVSPRRSRPPQP